MNKGRLQWEKLIEVFTDIEAQVIRGLLEAQGVTAHVSKEGYQTAIGLEGTFAATTIFVPNTQLAEAQKVLEGYINGDFANLDLDDTDLESGEDA